MKIVQVGCHDGNDHVFDIINNNIDAIEIAYLIEPLKESYDKAVEKYKNIPNVKLLNIAITDDDKEEIELFTPISKNVSNELTSYRKDHITKHYPNDAIINIESFKIKCKNINNLLKDLNLNKLDMLFIDTEGLDCRIIDSIDLDINDIKYIEFEFTHSENVLDMGDSETLRNTIKKLTNTGYSIGQRNINITAIK